MNNIPHLILLLGLLFGSYYHRLPAQSCASAIQMAKPLWRSFQKLDNLPPKEQYLQAKRQWQESLASQKQKPQYLGKEKSQQGKLWSQSQRHFMTLPIPGKQMGLTFKLTEGRGKVGIRICRISRDGKASSMQTIILNERTGAEGKKFSLKEAYGDILVVSLKNYGAVGAVGYSLKIE